MTRSGGLCLRMVQHGQSQELHLQRPVCPTVPVCCPSHVKLPSAKRTPRDWKACGAPGERGWQPPRYLWNVKLKALHPASLAAAAAAHAAACTGGRRGP